MSCCTASALLNSVDNKMHTVLQSADQCPTCCVMASRHGPALLSLAAPCAFRAPQNCTAVQEGTKQCPLVCRPSTEVLTTAVLHDLIYKMRQSSAF